MLSQTRAPQNCCSPCIKAPWPEHADGSGPASLEGNALQLLHLCETATVAPAQERAPAVPKGRGRGKVEAASSQPPETWQWVAGGDSTGVSSNKMVTGLGRTKVPEFFQEGLPFENQLSTPFLL